MPFFSIDYFIRSKYKANPYTYRKARLLVQTSFLTSLFSGFYCLQTAYLDMDYCKWAMFYNVVFFLLIPFLFRWGMASSAAANLYIFTGFVGVGICDVAQGITETTTFIWFALLPVVSLMLSNRMHAWVWTFIACLTVIGLGAVYEARLLVMDEAPADFKTYLEVSNITGFILIVFLVVLVFQRNTDDALKILDEKNTKLEETLVSLQAAQTQLIQSEKMASLGELTAGVAHEIQNPLNFINNFSEMNVEMVQELQAAQQLQPRNEAYESELFDDIRQNAEKILHHGKRADAIVKGMLQHSRKSTGHKEPTDINALIEEYLRLSFHGMRAKDKRFNAAFTSQLDAGIGKISIVPQDISRVLLNLCNNAFYAVHELAQKRDSDYRPTVLVGTKKKGDKVEIEVTDNGAGIDPSLADKIFQPFFTTKPSGHGTGLGLSLSYDIIKAHGGELKVTAPASGGTTFTIVLPASNK